MSSGDGTVEVGGGGIPGVSATATVDGKRGGGVTVAATGAVEAVAVFEELEEDAVAEHGVDYVLRPVRDKEGVRLSLDGEGECTYMRKDCLYTYG